MCCIAYHCPKLQVKENIGSTYRSEGGQLSRAVVLPHHSSPPSCSIVLLAAPRHRSSSRPPGTVTAR